MRILIWLAGLTLMVAACGGSEGGLAGKSFESTRVTGRELVGGTPISIAFEEDTISVTAGCNTIVGGYEAADGVLTLQPDAASTMMACEPPALMEQDEWLVDFLSAGVQADRGDGTLRLTGGDVVIEFAES